MGFFSFLNRGAAPNDGQGEGLRTAVGKLLENDNFLKDDLNTTKQNLQTLDTQVQNAGADKIVKHHLDGERAIINDPLAGRGHGDEVIFDLSDFFETESLLPISDNGFEVPNNLEASDYITVSDQHGFSGSKVIRTNKYMSFKSDYIPVRPGERLYSEIWIRHVLGPSTSKFFMGYEQFDSNKQHWTSNTGTVYQVNNTPSSTTWTKYSGYFTVPLSHTAALGSNGGPTYYVRVRLLANVSNPTDAFREFGGIVCKRIQKTHDIEVDGDVTCVSLTQTSDKKYKSNIELIDGEMALDIFKKLKFSAYDFSITDRNTVGLIAQEVERILPQAVVTRGNGDKAINYTYIDMICKAAIQHYIKTQML